MTNKTVVYTYGTGNPVEPNGSGDVRDGIDNLQSFDVFMNAPEDTYNQRDGGVVKTVSGMGNEFDSMIVDMNSEFNEQLSAMGYTRVGTFKVGATLTNTRQTLLWDIADGGDGQEYGWSGSFPKIVPPDSTPLTTGGISVGAWMSRFDPALKNELTKRTMKYRGTTLSLTDVVSVEDYRPENPTDQGCIQAAITANNSGTIKLEPGRTYNLTSDIVVLNKTAGNPNGTLTLDATGAFITGTGNLVVDSVKYLKTIGLQMPNQDIVINGQWYSSYESCIFRNIILSQAAGASFSASYWNTFKECNFQAILKYAIGANAHNEFTFYSCRVRGNAQQGFSGTADYAIRLIGNSNTQSWKFYGGDISYHNIAIYNIDPTNIAEIELEFDGVYFDTLLPQLTSRFKTTIRTKNCHNAVGAGSRNPLRVGFNSVVGHTTDMYSAARSFKFSGLAPKNLIPGGDLSNDLGTWSGQGKPVSAIPSGGTITGSPGGFAGNTITITSPGPATNFRTMTAPENGKLTGCIVFKNANIGEETIQVGFRGLFDQNITISDQYWTAYMITAEDEITAGNFTDMSVIKVPSAPYAITVGYVGAFYGTDTPLLSPSNGFATIELRDTTWDLSAGVPANSQVEKVFTVPGAKLGDFALHASETSSTNLKRLIFSARVTAADTVTVTATNPTASAITGLSATTITNLRVWKLKLFFG